MFEKKLLMKNVRHNENLMFSSEKYCGKSPEKSFKTFGDSNPGPSAPYDNGPAT